MTQQIKLFTVLLIGLVFFASGTTDIDHWGKKIQLDGFLLEWSQITAKNWDELWDWDAVNTADGPAGYFRLTKSSSCSSWTIFVSGDGSKNNSWKIKLEPPYTFESDLFKVDKSQSLLFEWVLPWDSLLIDTNGLYALQWNAVSACGDTLNPLLITGYSVRPTSFLTPALVGRVVIIVVLLVLFIVTKLRIKRRKLQRG